MKNTTIAKSSNFGKDLKHWRLYLLLCALMSVFTGYSQVGTISIGSGTANSASLVPINSCYGYNYTQQIVKATEYETGGGIPGQITKIRFYYASGGTTTTSWNNWTVYLGHTSKTEFTSNTDWEPLSSLTQVFTGTVTPVAGNWMEMVFTTPFTYNGTGNIVVAIDENTPNFSCTANFGSYTGSANTAIYYRSDGTNPDPASPPTATGRTSTLARIQFEGAVASCLAPSALATVNNSLTESTLSWTASASATANGYQYYVATSATAPTDVTAPTGSVAAGITSVTLSNLNATMLQYVWVRTVCTGSDVSAWAGPRAFYPGYCTPAPSSVDGSGIINVTMGTINNTTVAEPGNYGNYAAQTATFEAGEEVAFSVTYATGYTYGTKIWVDWNNDLDFDDEGELVYTGLSTNANPTTLSGTFMVPALASIVGNHRVRVGGTDTDSGGTPCYTGTWASYEDYTINVVLPPLPVVTSFTPEAYCAVEGEITITGTAMGNAVVTVGGTEIPVTSNTGTEIVAVAPAGVSGTVTVTTVSGSDTTTETFSVNAPTDVVLSAETATLCFGESTEVITITSGASAFDTFEWLPSEGVSGSVEDGFIFTPSQTTVYTLTASQSSGSCIISVEYAVTVNPVPAAVSVTPASADVCYGTPVALTASGGEQASSLDYCIPTVTSNGASGDFINNVTFANMVNNGSGDTASDYTYYSGLTANVVGGTAYTLTLQSGSAWSQQFRVWIDYNQDGVFSANESVYNTTSSSTAVFTGSVTIPVTAFNGVTRMRVACRFSSAVAAGDSCSHTGFGEYEDYNISITGATSPVDYVWSPVEGLYTDAAGTIAYDGEPAITVYAMPEVSGSYTATVYTDVDCSASATTALTVLNTPAPTGNAQQDFTSVATVDDLTADGDNIHWYTTATGGTPLAATAELTSGNYYATQTIDGCESFTRFAVSVTIPEMDWVNLQWPPVLTIVEGNTGEVYAQGYEAGVTPGAGPGIAVSAWIGISEENTDPSTWTNWVPMNFNVQVGNNDEFVAAIGAGLEPGTYYYASRFKLQAGPYSYGGYNAGGGSFWDGQTYVSGVLTVTCGTEAPMADAMQEFCNAATVANLMAEGTGVQWYTSATGGTALAVTANLTNGTTYYASQNTGCESINRTAVTVVIYNTDAPTGAEQQTFNAGALISDITVMGTGIVWYDSATGGNIIANNEMLEDGTSYYASQILNGCESPERLLVTVTVMEPMMDYVNLQYPGEITIAQGTAANVYAQGYEAGVTPGTGPGVGVMAWIGVSEDNTDPSTWTTWIPATFNIQVGNNDEFMAAIGAGLAPGTYYYASRFQLVDGPYSYGGYNTSGGNFWNGTTAVSGVLTVVCSTPAPVAMANVQSFCNSGTIGEISITGEGVVWYDAAEGGAMLDETTELTNGMMYYASQTINGCESITRTQVTVVVNTVEAPDGESVQVIEINVSETATIEDIVADYTGTITWYPTEQDAVNGTNALAMGTEVVAGNTYYATQTIGNCTSESVFAVTVDVNLDAKNFDVASFSFYPNPVRDMLNLSYSSDITSVTVFNMLGQQVLAAKPNSVDAKIDMSSLAEGTYVVNVEAGNVAKTIKVVVKK